MSPWGRRGAPDLEERGRERLSARLPQSVPLHLLLLEPGPEIPRDPGQAMELGSQQGQAGSFG